jgi:hypothetical protein
VVSLHALYYQSELNKIWAHLGGATEGSSVVLPAPAASAQRAEPTGL